MSEEMLEVAAAAQAKMAMGMERQTVQMAASQSSQMILKILSEGLPRDMTPDERMKEVTRLIPSAAYLGVALVDCTFVEVSRMADAYHAKVAAEEAATAAAGTSQNAVTEDELERLTRELREEEARRAGATGDRDITAPGVAALGSDALAVPSVG